MPRKLWPEHRLELESLYRVAATIAAWCDEQASAPNASPMSDALRHTYEGRDLRGLRIAYNDLVVMTRAANATQRRVLDARLRKEANTSLGALDKKAIERIDRIRARGRITSEEQYYFVREHVEFIAGDPDHPGDARELVELLDAYEQRASRKAGE